MSRKIKVGISRDLFDKEEKFFTPGPGLKLLDDVPNLEWEMFSEFIPFVPPSQVAGFDMVITLKPRWNDDSFVGNNQLLCLMRNGVGYDDVEVPSLIKPGVLLCNTPIAVRRPLATAIIGFVLALSLKMFQKDRIIREGRWTDRTNYVGDGLVGKTLGSIGVGGIGHEMFKLAMPFGMKHMAFDPYISEEAAKDVNVTLVDMEKLLREADFVSISCPLNEKTFHLVGEKELKTMKETAFLINTSRGPVVDEAVLTKALQENWIRGAAIDVFEQEPTPADNPLLKLDNVIVTPHAVGSTDEVWSGKWDENVAQVLALAEGKKPESLVNKEIWDTPQFQEKLRKFLAETGGIG